MKETYEKPEVEVVMFDKEDIAIFMAASGPGSDSGYGDGGDL